MKILAIRGCNLASLAGEFEIDLAHGPLGGAGVFAIVGNTGAGKSTLLDALCAALFDRTPRLTNHSRVVVGRGEDDPAALGAQDVRTILRRGATAGWAEVDFESRDARRYRARWSVRRARGQMDGNLQDQQITLTAIESPGFAGARSNAKRCGETIDGGERLGGTKTETLKAIHARLGLSFDQFRRSALLAQGEFAAFLRADGKDRSELLERMTGTEIYSRLSIAAHLRAALAEQQLRDRRAAAMGIAVLDDAARVQAQADLAVATAAKEASRARLASAEAAARWLAEAASRERALVDAVGAEAAAGAAVIGAEAERAELALRRRAEALRSTWDDVVRLDRQLASCRGELAAAIESVERTERAQGAIAAAAGRLRAVGEPIRAARIAARIVERPAFVAPVAARIVERSAVVAPVAVVAPADRRRAVTLTGAGGMALGVASRVPAHVELDAPWAELAADAEARARAASGDAAWLVAQAGLASEIAAWPELEVKFAQHASVGEAIASADRALRLHAEDRAKLVRVRDGTAVEHKAAIAQLAEAQRKAAAFQQRRGLTLDAARRQEDEARVRCGELQRLAAIATGARQAVIAIGEVDRQLAELVAAAERDAAERRDAEATRERAGVLRGERQRVLGELRLAAGYQHARAELVAGEPCPLCGATEHPWRDRGAFDDVIRDAEAELGSVAAQLEAAVDRLAAIAAREHHRELERARIASGRATIEHTTRALVASWREQLAALGELMLVDDPATEAALALAEDRVDAARKRLEAARDTRSQTEATTKAAQDAQGQIQTCQANLDQIALKLGELDRRLAEIDAAVERQRGEREVRLARHHELARELDEVVARWTAAIPDGELAATHGARRLAMAALVELWHRRATAVAAADAVVEAALAEIDRAARDSERAVAEHGARRDDAQRRRDARLGELAEATARLDAARAAAGFDADELRRVLAGSGGGRDTADAVDLDRARAAGLARIDALAALLAALDRAIETARAIVAERRRLVAEHAAVRPAELGDAADVEALAKAVDDADAHAARLDAALAADADARVRRDAALADLAVAETVADVDRRLGAVIGSHDGKLFRSFAQSLTLDSLLEVANGHLEELAPRYQLERVPRHDLEIQVIDRDLGSEVRSVQSLSGGESFLVSLALALGLSSMSAHDVRVRTLLIDEGFGSLDPSTLDTALAVLDALQATGRQVGVISHVPALVERVGAHVHVVQRGGGRSEVIVADG